MSTRPADAARRRLAVAMIVRDEEAVLAESIESVRGVADDVYVLDTGSSDDTPALARRLGAKVAQIPWPDDFSAARNVLANEIDADWILWLDAGERLSRETAAALRKFVDLQADPNRVYMMIVSAPPPDPSGSAEQIAQARLMPKNVDLLFSGRVRETVWSAVEALRMQVDMAPGQIVRHPRQHDPARKLAKAQRDLRLVELEESEGPLPTHLLVAKAEAHVALGRLAQAQDTFRRAIDSAEQNSSGMLEAYYGLMATFDDDPSKYDLQREIALEALEIYPLDAQLLCAMGNYLQRRERLDLATRAFDMAVKYGQVDIETWHLAEIAEMAAVCLALGQQLQNNDRDAQHTLEEAHSRFPDSTRVSRHLLDVFVKRNQTEEAVQLAERLWPKGGDFNSRRNAVLGACKATKQDWLAALGYLQSAYVAGYRDPFCLRWLVVTYLSSGQTAPAQSVLAEWLREEPDNPEALTYLKALREPTAADTSRQFRVDPAVTVEEAPAPRFPAVDASFSIDAGMSVDQLPEPS